MGAKQCPVMFRVQYMLLLFVEKHLREGETAGGAAGGQAHPVEALRAMVLCP